MNINCLQLKRALRTALLVLLLIVVGMGKMYAYDFSAVCETGQMLYFNIIDATNHYVELTYPGNGYGYWNGWENYSKPTGNIILPNNVTYNGITYMVTSIGNDTFFGCSDLTGSLTIPNSVTTIGNFAFDGCSGFTGSLTIPNSVTTIGNSAFSSCSGFTGSLTIPSSVTTIGNSAFSNCSGLSGSLTISNSVTTIGNSTFYNCSGLTGDLTIPSTVTTIGLNAFHGCIGFSGSLTIPNSVTTIRQGAFQDCSGFTGSLTIGNSVISIDNYAFENCNSFTGDLIIPNSVTTIGYGAFNGCSGFTGSLIIGSSVTTIGGSAFRDCSGFTGGLTIPNSVTTIDRNSFENCSGFTGSLTIPNSVTTLSEYSFHGCNGFTGSLIIGNSVNTIGFYAFLGCSGFTGDLTIGDSVTTISNGAFSGCSGFTGSLTIGNSITVIGNYAFWQCRGFSSITILAETPPSLGDYNWNVSAPPVYVPCGFEEAYSSLSWGGFSNFVGLCGGSVIVTANSTEYGTVTGGGMFEAGQVCTVTANPNEGYLFNHWTRNGIRVSTEAEYSFYVASDEVMMAHFLIDGNIVFADDNVKSICVANWDTDGDGELSYEEAASVTSLNNYFQGNTQITSFEELKYFIGLTSIGQYEFSNCSNLSGNLFIPNSVISIGYEAFQGCSGFTGSLIIPNLVTTIGARAFLWCSGFTGDLVIPNTVTSIGGWTFCGCSGFTGSLTIGNSVTSIGQSAFTGCNNFTGNLTIPNSVTTIGIDAFYNCSGFTGNLTIGNSVTAIGQNAFSNCSSFTSVTSFAETPPSMGNYVFGGWNTGIPVYVPCGFDEAYQTVLGWNNFTNILGMCSGTIIVVANPSDGGTVTGGGYYNGGDLCVLTATPNPGFGFGNWTENGRIVSTDTIYSFHAHPTTIVANFCSYSPIVFADANVKDLCVTNWDTNGDGELSYAEAAAVTDLGQVFKENTEITSFEELQYFIGLTSISSNAFYNCSNLSGSLYIPNSVTTIGYSAFENCSGFTGNLIIGNSVTSIGDRAFLGCSGFTGSLTIGNSVTSIGGNAFSGCSGFTGNLIIPNSVTYLGRWAFSMCSGFTGSLTLGNSLTTISYAAFFYCSGFTGDLVIPNSVTTIDDMAFYGCCGFTGSLTIGDSVTVIGNSAFVECNGFTGLIIPSSVIEIGTNPFSMCIGIEQIMVDINNPTYDSRENCNAIIETSTNRLISGCKNSVILDGVATIGYSAFNGCSGMTGNLTIPNSVTSISSYAFRGCSGLTGDLVIPNSVTTIGECAFENCSGFTGSLTIGDSVTSISSHAFMNCSGFTGVYYTGDIDRWCHISFGDGYANPLCYAHNLYIDNTLVTELVLPENLTEIKDYTFVGGTCFTGSLIIPNTVTIIGVSAFYGCSGFTGNLTIPNSVTSIGSSAFFNCTSFDGTITLGNSLETIGSAAFTAEGYIFGIPTLVGLNFTGELVIPNTVTSIGDYAFFGYRSFTEVIIFNSNPPSLGSSAFSNANTFFFYVPYESLNDYKTAENWSNYEYRIFPMAYKTIPGYGEDEGNYCFVASPLVENTAPTAVDNMITETVYDLYRFNQSEELEWENYMVNTEDFMLENGQGYLYANFEETNIIFKGAFNEEEEKIVELVYDEGKDFAGWNLVGNPFPISAYANKSYYMMNEDGTGVVPVAVSTATAIPACTGVMVKAETTGESVTFSKTAPEATANYGVLQIALSQVPELVEEPSRNQVGVSTGSTTLLDKAIVSFNTGDRLEKFTFNQGDASLSIPQGSKDFAIAWAEKQGEIPLNFKAIKGGTYSLSVSLEEVEMDYLHLIDNMTGADIDLLNTPSYSFEAKTTDYESRFKLVFASVCEDADGDNETFAFFSNGNWIINNKGEAALQVIDMQGRILSSETISGSCNKAIHAAPGVYMIRLINGENVKTQKIIIE